jgi:hypothetical protein
LDRSNIPMPFLICTVLLGTVWESYSPFPLLGTSFDC